MTKIKDVTTALFEFEDAAKKHAEATEQGDYKAGNKNYDRLIMAKEFLKKQDRLDDLLNLLNHQETGVRMAAATFLLPLYEMEAVKVLEEIAESSNFNSFIAETTLSEWKKGNLKL